MIARLRRRLALGFVAALAGLLVLFAGLGHLGLRAALLGHADEGNAHLVAPLVAAYARGGPTAVRRAFDALAPGPGEHVALLDPTGTPIASRGQPPPPGLPPPAPGVATAADGGWRTLTTPLRPWGWVRAAHSLAPMAGMLRLQAGLALAAAAIILLLGWAAGQRLAAWAAAPVAEALGRERALTRDASHELRTPLAVIRGQAELALADGGLAAGPRAKLEAIAHTAARMGALVGDLLTLGRAEAVGAEGALRFSLADVVEEACELLAPLARERGVALAVATPPAAAEVRGDPDRLAQVVRNLLDNAIRYAPAGGRVDVGLAADGARWTLRVANDGPPIPAAEREAIFERFHRAPAGRLANPGGSGLGLAIARAVARAHGGDVALASRPGERTAFTLSLPAAQDR